MIFMPTLSVIIPTMNEEKYLPKLLECIKRQTRQPDEIIIADAGSTDRTKKIAEDMGAVVVKGGLPGPGRNAGAAAAKGDILCFFDADIVLLDDRFFEKAVAEFEERKLDIACPDITLADKNVKSAGADEFGHVLYNKYVRLFEKIHPHVVGMCIFVRRELHEKIKGFDETVVFCEDHEYGLRAHKVGRFAYLNSVQIGVTDRRIKKEGRAGLVIKTLLAEAHIWTLGPIRHHFFRYEFGYKPGEAEEKG
jgi:glycosyltransferase involved in cell wall biosynthesis